MLLIEILRGLSNLESVKPHAFFASGFKICKLLPLTTKRKEGLVHIFAHSHNNSGHSPIRKK